MSEYCLDKIASTSCKIVEVLSRKLFLVFFLEKARPRVEEKPVI